MLAISRGLARSKQPPAVADTRKLSNQLVAWGMSMSLVGAVLCYLLFG